MTKTASVPDRSVPQRVAAEASSSLMSSSNATSEFDPASYTKPFIHFMTDNPTIYHAIGHFGDQLKSAGFTKLSEKDEWSDKLEVSGKYFFTRNGSSLIAFTVGEKYKPGNGVAMIASHVDSLAAKLKPVSLKANDEGYQLLGVAQYAGALNQTWLDRDLGIGGRVFVKNSDGKIETKLVKLDWPIARIPTLAPHFGFPSEGQPNRETRMVPIIGIDNSDISSSSSQQEQDHPSYPPNSFAATQPPHLLHTIATALSVPPTSIENWELELFDAQPAQVGGLNKELIFSPRLDDKLCSWAAVQALLLSTSQIPSSSTINLVGLFDAEEIGSLVRQGARSNLLPSTISRVVEALSLSLSAKSSSSPASTLGQTYASSFLLSADNAHAYNPNYPDAYLPHHRPRLNLGVAVAWDSNMRMVTDAASATIFKRLAEKSGSALQLFQIRNDGRSGGTIGDMLSARMGVRAVDAGIPQLSMHSIRAVTGARDPGEGVRCFRGVLEGWGEVEGEFLGGE